jgi:type IV fimbrial biogenesis protein FimT
MKNVSRAFTAVAFNGNAKQPSRSINSGLTLIELLIVIAIVGIVLASGLPHYRQLVARNQATTVVNWLISSVHFARYSAASHGITVTLCALEGKTCTKNWHTGLTLFVDSNQNGRLDSKEKTLANLKPVTEVGSIAWRSFGRKPYLQFTAMGHTNFQNGNITYCPKDKNILYRRQIVISVQGRPRQVHTRNLAGHPIDRHGRVLKC